MRGGTAFSGSANGCLRGSKNLDNRIAAWRWTLGASGAVLLGLILFIGSGFVETAYYNYSFRAVATRKLASNGILRDQDASKRQGHLSSP